MHVHNLDQNLLMYWIYFLLFIMRLKKKKKQPYVFEEGHIVHWLAEHVAICIPRHAEINEGTDFLDDLKDFVIPSLDCGSILAQKKKSSVQWVQVKEYFLNLR